MPFTSAQSSLLSTQPLVLQYFFFLALVFLETMAFHLPIRLICSQPRRPLAIEVPRWAIQIPVLQFFIHKAPAKEASTPVAQDTKAKTSTEAKALEISDSAKADTRYLLPISPIPHYPHPVPLSTALFVSSCTKLFPILLIIWEYDLPSAATAVSWAVIVNNIAALEILMDCGYVQAAMLVAIGALCRGLVAWCVLGMVGLGNSSGVGVLEGLGLGIMS